MNNNQANGDQTMIESIYWSKSGPMKDMTQNIYDSLETVQLV